MRHLKNITRLLRQVYVLASPFGRKKLAAVLLVVVLQGFFQMVGISAVFPFLALASDPERIYHSRFGGWFVGVLPEMEHGTLLIVAGLVAILMLLIANVINLVSEWFRARYANYFGHWLRLRLLNRFACRPYGFFLTQNSGVLVKKVMNDVNQYVQGVLFPLLDSAARFITFVFLLMLLFLAEPFIASVTALGLGLFYGAFLLGLQPIRSRMSHGMKAALRGSFVAAQQFFGGIKPIFVHGKSAYFVERFAVHSRKMARIRSWLPVLGNGPRFLIEPIAFGGLVAVVVYYAAAGRDFVSILPNLGVMALAAYRILPNVQWLYSQMSAVATQRHALDEVFCEFMTAESESNGPSAAASEPTEIEFRREILFDDLSFRYSGCKEYVLKHVSLNIPRGESVAFVGETGSGKSTIVDLLMGLHRPVEGRLLVDGMPLETPSQLRAWQERIGYVPQEIFLTDDTITRNVAFGVEDDQIDDARVREVARMAQIAEYVEQKLPDRYQSVVGERGVRLSGGQRQRIALARALYHRPEVLVLDEATSALDLETEARFMEVVYTLAGGITIVIVAHRLATVERCSLQFTVEGGSVRSTEVGRPRDSTPAKRSG